MNILKLNASIIIIHLDICTYKEWMNEWMNEWSGYLHTAFHKVIDLISKRYIPQTSLTSWSWSLQRLWQLHKELLPGMELGILGLPVRRLNH